MLQLGLAEKARGNLDTASDWLARACAQDPASAVARFYLGEVLYNRGLNEPALAALRAGDRAQPRLRRGALPARLRLRRHGPARGGPRRRPSAPSSSIPTLARAQANLALERYGRGTARRPAPDARASADRRGRRARALQPRPRLPAEGPARGGAARVPAGARRRRGPPAHAPGDGGGAPAAARAARRRSSSTTRWSASSPTRRSSGTSAASCLHQAGRRAEAIASYERAVGRRLRVPARLEQPRRHPRRRRGRRPAIAAFRRALDGDRPLFAARLNLGLLFLQRRQLRPALEEYQGALAEQSGERRRRGTASASCSWSSRGSRTRGTPSAARWMPTRASPARTTT